MSIPGSVFNLFLTKNLFNRSGFMNQYSQVQRDVMIQKLASRYALNETYVASVVDQCIKNKGVDECETAHDIFQCYRTILVPLSNHNSTTNPGPSVIQSNSTPTAATKNTDKSASSSTSSSKESEATPTFSLKNVGVPRSEAVSSHN